MFALCVLLSCSRDETKSGESIRRFAEDVLLADYRPEGPPAKVVFIGLDGATWNIINPMIERGELPTFKRLKEEGAWGKLRSTECFLSSPAWGAMMTGCSPEKMGIYAFGMIDSFGMEPIRVTSLDIQVPSVWDITSAAGLRTGVVNIPITYPLRPVNGIMVTGFLTSNAVPMIDGKSVELGFQRMGKSALYRKTGTKSYSYPGRVIRTILGNKMEIFLIDSTDNNQVDFDLAILFVTPLWRNRPVRSEEQKVTCQIDSLSSWVKINYALDQSLKWGWARLKLRSIPSKEKSRYPRIELKCYPVYFAMEDTSVKFCYPEDLREPIERSLKHYFPYAGYGKPEMMDYVFDKEEHLNYFYNHDDWDFFLFEFQEHDRLSHEDGFGPYTRELYRRTDEILGRFIERLPEDAVLIMASDHGFKEFKYMIDVNSWFESIGLLKRTEDQSIDWDHSFAYHYQWGIHVNRKHLEENYTSIQNFEVKSGVNVYEAFLDWLIEKGAGFSRPGTDERMPIEFTRYLPSAIGPVPALCVDGGSGTYRISPSHWRKEVIPLFTDFTSPEYSGSKEKYYHEQDGIFLAWGKHIKRGYETDTKSIMDVAPTMLYALGLPVVEYMDGSVMLDLFENEFVRRNPVNVYANYADLDFVGSRGDVEDAERVKVEEQMRALGYIE